MTAMRNRSSHRGGMIAAIALATLAACGGSTAGASVAEELNLQELRSRHYDVITNVDRETARAVARHMDQVYRAYMNRIGGAGFRRKVRGRMKLYLLQTHDQYVKVLSDKGIDAAGTGGLFMARGDFRALLTFVQGRSERRMYATLQHEGFHQFAYMMIGDLPPWANEGLAEYFGDAGLIDGKLELGQVGRDRLSRLQQAIGGGEAYGFDTLLNMSPAAWRDHVRRGRRAHLLYDQSWSIVHFLVHADRGRYRKALMGYLRLIHRGMDSDAAFKKAFGTDQYEAFEDRWEAYVKKLNPDPAAEARLRLSVLAEGLKKLADQGVAPTSLDQLQRALKRINFRARVGSHGANRTFSADDDALFEPPPAAQAGASTDLTLEPGKGDLPPTLTVRGLPAPVRLTWRRDEDGELSYAVVRRR